MGRDLRTLIAGAVTDRDVDILLLAESHVPDDEITAVLKVATSWDFAALSDDTDKVRLFTRLPVAKWQKRQTDALSARMAIWSVAAGKPPGILLASAHFISKSNISSDEQGIVAVELAKEILRVEEHVGHQRTVVVGDLNMNPFDIGVTGVTSLHAVMTKHIADKKERVFQGKKYRFFYNPMWGFFGDRTIGPPGTYYHSSPSPGDIFWHMIDQVLLRPALMNLLHDLTIIDFIGAESLLTENAGVPRASDYSDHLPLAFRLQLD